MFRSFIYREILLSVLSHVDKWYCMPHFSNTHNIILYKFWVVFLHPLDDPDGYYRTSPSFMCFINALKSLHDYLCPCVLQLALLFTPFGYAGIGQKVSVRMFTVYPFQVCLGWLSYISHFQWIWQINIYPRYIQFSLVSNFDFCFVLQKDWEWII